MRRVYLDHHATTPVDQRVLEIMLPYFSCDFGNAASTTHVFGREAAQAVAQARVQVAGLIGTDPMSIIFTGGATESINLALKGLAEFYGSGKRHLITCRAEHPAVLDTCSYLEARHGFRITRLGLDPTGRINLDDLTKSITDETLAISIAMANHEIGTIQDVTAIGKTARHHGVFFHCDAAQAVGKIPIDVEAMGIDLLSLSAHKFYGPKGVGALFVRRKNPRVRLGAQTHGGGHERGLRSGTLNVPLIVGMGHACELAASLTSDEARRLRDLRGRLLKRWDERGLTYHINGDLERRLAGNLNVRFPAVPASALMRAVPELALSAGSACTTAVPSPSRVLLALGLDADAASECVRIGLGRFNTAEEIDFAAERIADAVCELAARDHVPEEAATC